MKANRLAFNGVSLNKIARRLTPAVQKILERAEQMADFDDDRMVRVIHIEQALAEIDAPPNAEVSHCAGSGAHPKPETL